MNKLFPKSEQSLKAAVAEPNEQNIRQFYKDRLEESLYWKELKEWYKK